MSPAATTIRAGGRQGNAKTVPVQYRLRQDDYDKLDAIAGLTGMEITDVLRMALRDWLDVYTKTPAFDDRRRRYVDDPAAEYEAYVDAGDPLAAAPTPPQNPYRGRVGRKDGADVIAGTVRLAQFEATKVAIKATQLGISQNDLIVEAADRWVNNYPRSEEFKLARQKKAQLDAQRCLLLGVPFIGPPPPKTSPSNRKARTRNTPTNKPSASRQAVLAPNAQPAAV